MKVNIILVMMMFLSTSCAITPEPSPLNSMQNYASMNCTQLSDEYDLVTARQEHLKNKAANSDGWGTFGALAMGMMAAVASQYDASASQSMVGSGTALASSSSLESKAFNEESQVLENRKDILRKIMLMKKCS